MSVSTRLQQVSMSLSPLQRTVLVLQATREGREPDPALRRFDDEHQRRAFNRYMALLWVINQTLGAITNITGHRVQVVENAAFQYELLSEAAVQVEAQEGRKQPVKGSLNWREGRDEASVPFVLRSLALENREAGVNLLLQLWQELTCIESVWQDLSAEFAGEDPVEPEQRALAKEIREALLSAAKRLGVKKLPEEVDEPLAASFHELVNSAFTQFGMVEPYA